MIFNSITTMVGDEEVVLRPRFLVIHAPGWPGGIEPHPNTEEHARRFVAENGGQLRVQWRSDWRDVG